MKALYLDLTADQHRNIKLTAISRGLTIKQYILQLIKNDLGHGK